MAREQKKDVITIEEVNKTGRDDDGNLNYVNFTSACGRKWNYKYNPQYDEQNIARGFQVGKHIEVMWSPFTNSRGTESRYVNSARSVPDSVPDSETKRGGGHNGGSNGSKKKDDYDPEVGKRQTAANCAMSYCAQQKLTLDEIAVTFPAVADIVLKWVNEKPDATFQQAHTDGHGEDGGDAGSFAATAPIDEDDDCPF